MMMVEKLWRYVKPFSYNTSVSRTDRRTDGQTDRITISISRVSSSMLTRDKNRVIAWHIPTTWTWTTWTTRFTLDRYLQLIDSDIQYMYVTGYDSFKELYNIIIFLFKQIKNLKNKDSVGFMLWHKKLIYLKINSTWNKWNNNSEYNFKMHITSLSCTTNIKLHLQSDVLRVDLSWSPWLPVAYSDFYRASAYCCWRAILI